MRSQSTVAVERGNVALGVGQPVSVSPYIEPAQGLDLASRLTFFASEIFGLLFVLMCTTYIFVMPTALTRPGQGLIMISRLSKRALDILGATVGLTLSLPFFLLLPIIIKLDSPGPIFYTQLRVGINRRRKDRRYHQKVGIRQNHRGRDRRLSDCPGRPFKVIKFRTMTVDAESKSGPVWARKADPRITRIGRFLRLTRIDEVPQFLNVLKGEMSLVGPRPERPHFVKELTGKIDRYVDRLDVKPGLTGLAQIENGYDSTIAGVAKKVEWDLQYIENSSLWYDIKILLRTVIVVLTGRGAC